MTTELKPCPFCGETGSVRTVLRVLIRCDNCGAQGCSFSMVETGEKVAIERAAAAWNTRASAPPVGEGWQPIETAPKDGTLVMVGAAGCGVSLVRWMLDAWLDEQGFTQGNWPTHWMPLPPPPASSGEA